MKAICVFSGSSLGRQAAYSNAAKSLGIALAERNIRMIYGGGNVGLMGICATACLAAGGWVTGFIPKLVADSIPALPQSDRSVVTYVENLRERKKLMTVWSDAFIALPGGIGTMDELFEVLVENQLGVHAKPVGLLSTQDYFDPLLGFLKHCVAEKFLRPEHYEMLCVERMHPEMLVDQLMSWKVPAAVAKWVDEAPSGIGKRSDKKHRTQKTQSPVVESCVGGAPSAVRKT